MLSIFIICTILLQIVGTRGVFGLKEACETNLDCAHSAICKENNCVCDQVSFAKNEKCLPYATEYKAYCQDPQQCQEWLGDKADCINNVCTCKKDLIWYQGKCQNYASKGQTCSKSIICFDIMDPLALKCSSGTCTCSNGYYDRGPDCRKKSTTGNCAIDMDCADTNLICQLGKCLKKKHTTFFHEIPQFYNTQNNSIFELTPYIKQVEVKNLSDNKDKITCNYDSDCKMMKNSLCDETTNTCKCKSNTPFLHDGNCLPGFGICKSDDECVSYLNTMCFHNVCICQKGFFYNGNTCIPELGIKDLSLTSISSCTIKPAFYQDHTCFCLDYWFRDDSNRNCIKTTLQETSSCLTNEWCNAMGLNSFCNSRNQCQCGKSATLNSRTFYCEGNPAAVCLRDSDCSFNERCQYQKCTCIENFLKDTSGDNLCHPDLEGTCIIESCSHAANSNCIQGICKCNKNYLDYEKKCLLIAESWNDTCQVAKQCQNFKFADCNLDTKKCTCMEGYTSVDGACWKIKEYGDPCMNENECTKVLNKYYQCRNSKCICPIGQTLDSGFCVISSSNCFQPILFLLYISLSCYILI